LAEKEVDSLPGAPKGFCPLVEETAAGRGQLVGASRRSRCVCLPGGGDQAVLLERAKHSVEVAHVDATLSGELGERLEQLVAVTGPLAQ